MSTSNIDELEEATGGISSLPSQNMGATGKFFMQLFDVRQEMKKTLAESAKGRVQCFLEFIDIVSDERDVVAIDLSPDIFERLASECG